MNKNGLRQALIGMVLLAVGGGTAAAHELSSYKLASHQFNELAARAKPQHRMPSRSEPAAASVLAVMSDHQRFFGKAKYTVKDTDAVLDMCDIANRTARAYLVFELAAYVDRSMAGIPGKVEALTRQVVTGNINKYQNEMIPLLVFQQHCTGAVLPLLSAYTAALPRRRMTKEQLEGLAQVRRGVVKLYLGSSQTALETGLSATNRHMLFDSLTQMSPLFSQVLDLPARREVRDYFRGFQATAPKEFQPYVKQINQTLESPACTGMCLL
jgi:hypothetical protein